MGDIAIRADNLSKQYRIGMQKARYQTFRDALVTAARAPLHWFKGEAAQERNKIWALKDISFEIKHGEAVGIIGRNGAGKSTLLKILSRITKPTRGRADIFGRVGSLLEVGTGFHPELTGRDNIYLNGAILGMRRSEIDRKFDEIVAFSEIEKFLDTPVKYYSSGMYVRLAFAVAAHLEPEILLVDEVLAVGDAQFQKKCLGKMGDVAQGGRTVLFVSHNMQAVRSLCSDAFLLNGGKLVSKGDVQSIIREYMASQSLSKGEVVWEPETAPGNSEARLISIRVLSDENEVQESCPSDQDILIEMSFLSEKINKALCVGFDLITADGTIVFRSYQTDLPFEEWLAINMGINRWRCIIPAGLLNAGEYFVCPRLSIHKLYWIVKQDMSVKFNVVLGHGVSPFWNSIKDANSHPGVIAPILKWVSAPGSTSSKE
jgi:lipopolysaccharide transport system ATP-binding protein